jgi:hypothetical protein
MLITFTCRTSAVGEETEMIADDEMTTAAAIASVAEAHADSDRAGERSPISTAAAGVRTRPGATDAMIEPTEAGIAIVAQDVTERTVEQEPPEVEVRLMREEAEVEVEIVVAEIDANAMHTVAGDVKSASEAPRHQSRSASLLQI